MDSKEFGVYLAKIRERNGFKSQRQLALEANMSPATISRIEGGIQQAQPDTLLALSKVLKDVTYYELLQKAGYISEETVDQMSNVIRESGIKYAQGENNPEQRTVELLSELVKRYNLDLTNQENVERLETILSWVISEHKKGK